LLRREKCPIYNTSRPDSVETEIRQQVRRLHHHPAIVIWATNNEVEVAAAQSWYGPGTDKLEYRRRFKDSIAKIVEENEAPSGQAVDYIPRKVLLSSPGNGDASKDPYGIDPNPQDPLAGDVHFYSYVDDLWDECTYPVTRFTSEYGIMSLPGPLAWLRSLDKNQSHPDDWNIYGAMMLHRLHKKDGIEILRKYVFEKFGEPRGGATSVENYIIWTYLTQLYQAVAYKTHINHLERHRCTISNGTPSDDCSNVWKGQGNSMGHLYWQLNDIWAAPTWSTIDVAGQWKIAHYLAIRGTSTITHPIGRIIVSHIRDQVLINWVPPIKPSIKSAITIRILCPSIASFDQLPAILFENRVEQWEPNGCPIRITKFQKNQLLSRCPWGVLTTMIDNITQQTNDTALILTPKYMRPFWPKNVSLITVNSIKRVDRMYFSTPRPPFHWKQVFEISLISDVPEFYVWLIVDPYKDIDGWFTDNAFNMVTSNRKTVLYFLKGNSSLSPNELKNAIKIYSLGSVLT
uniref:Beta-mannosidase n=1 Tax=Hymenolepis diminuta TaxID=6216 RepID=A0A0R3SH89_HYMDI